MHHDDDHDHHHHHHRHACLVLNLQNPTDAFKIVATQHTWMHHRQGMATAIVTNLNRTCNRNEIPQWETILAMFACFIANVSQLQSIVWLPRKITSWNLDKMWAPFLQISNVGGVTIDFCWHCDNRALRPDVIAGRPVHSRTHHLTSTNQTNSSQQLSGTTFPGTIDENNNFSIMSQLVKQSSVFCRSKGYGHAHEPKKLIEWGRLHAPPKF